MNTVGVCYHPKNEAGRALSNELCDKLRGEVANAWLASAWDARTMAAHLPATDLLFCVGGDGTVLRAARSAVRQAPLLLGVNLGRIGFLTEIDRSELWKRLPEILAGKGRVEKRAMLQASLVDADGSVVWGGDHQDAHVLNDLVVGRSSLGRILQLCVVADGIRIADYRADGVVVATATGSTAYSLALGGPILYPESREIVVCPVAPHLAESHAVVLPATAHVQVEVTGGSGAVISYDGETGPELRLGQVVHVYVSPYVARFLRLGPPSDFYARVARRLNWVREPGAAAGDERQGERKAERKVAVGGRAGRGAAK